MRRSDDSPFLFDLIKLLSSSYVYYILLKVASGLLGSDFSLSFNITFMGEIYYFEVILISVLKFLLIEASGLSL